MNKHKSNSPDHGSYHWIDNEDKVQECCAHLKKSKKVGLDTEFIRETTFFPMLALIQVSDGKESWLIDPIKLNKAQLEPFFDLMEDPGVLKIFHAAQADQEALYTKFKKIAKPSFDTAVAASLLGYGDSVGLSKLLKEVLSVHVPKGHARTDWSKRPLPAQLLKYAHQDVLYLVELADRLEEELKQFMRMDWAIELSSVFENEKLYEPQPENLAARAVKNSSIDNRSYSALVQLMGWREKRVRELNIPRRRLADDETLFSLAVTRPKNFEHLASFRGLNRGEIKQSADELISLFENIEGLSDAELVSPPKIESVQNDEQRGFDLLNLYLKTLSDELKIAAKHLITPDGLLFILRNSGLTAQDLVAKGILPRGAADMVGESLLKFSRGEISLRLQKKNVVTAPIS
jgi:ribonuclease D